jgi:hypothetical protein
VSAALLLLDERTPTPAKVPCLRLVTDENATVCETFRIHYAGKLGSPRFVRTVAAGTRVTASEWDDDAGLCRVRVDALDEDGALVDARHVRPDEGIPS